MPYLRVRLDAKRLSAILTALNNYSINAREITQHARMFKQELTLEQARLQLANLTPSLRPLYTATLRMLDTNEIRKGDLDKVFRFCWEHQMGWNVHTLKSNEIARKEYIQALERSFPDFETLRLETQRELRKLLGKEFQIIITADVSRKLDPEIFDHWVEFIRTAKIDGSKLREIVLTSFEWKVFLTWREATVEVFLTQGGYLRETKSLLIDAYAKSDLRFVVYHEIAEILKVKFLPEALSTRSESEWLDSYSAEEFLVDYLAWKILEKIDPQMALLYHDWAMARHVMRMVGRVERLRYKAKAKKILSKLKI